MTKIRIGFIGLGALGRPMAARLLDRDFPLIAYNRTASKAKKLARRGARVKLIVNVLPFSNLHCATRMRASS